MPVRLTETYLRKVIRSELKEMMDNDYMGEPGESPNIENIDQLKGYIGNALFELEKVERQSDPRTRNGIANAMELIRQAQVLLRTGGIE